MSYTKGPWYLLQTDGADFTAISTKNKMPMCEYRTNKDGSPKPTVMDLDNEVLGSSEWLRASEEDLTLMSASPELYECFKELLFKIDNQGKSEFLESALRKRCLTLLDKLKEIE